MEIEKMIEEKYNKIVKDNITKMENNEITIDKLKLYYDPDNTRVSERLVDNETIRIAQDGLCGIKQVFKLSENPIEDYRLIREGMYDFLYWPKHRVSINQMRWAKFRDRIDLLLLDLEKFYEIVGDNKELTSEICIQIKNNCGLGKSYIKPHTFHWLRSFIDFNDFLEKRKLKVFLCENEKRIEWPSPEKENDKQYYDTLIERVKVYRKLYELN